MAPGGCFGSTCLRIAAASAIEEGDARSQCQVPPDTGNTVVATAVDRICRPDGANCDADQTFWLYAGLGWFSSGVCTASHDTGGHVGNYGYCIAGATSGQPVNNLPGGNRSGYQEAKLWNYGSNTGRDYQERIFYR